MNRFHHIPPYSLDRGEKERLLLPFLVDLTNFHSEHCAAYGNFLKAIGYDSGNISSVADLPFMPVRAFKELELKSIADEQVFKLMTSSGTTGQKTSRIYLDKTNAVLQQKVLLRLLGDFIGVSRKPMLVIDAPRIMGKSGEFGTRRATMVGLSYIARGVTFALHDDLSLDLAAVKEFLLQHGREDFIIFGFTYMVWQYLFQALAAKGERLDFSKGILLTTGGWKKLTDKAVSQKEFKETGQRICRIGKYLDHYGMAEQTGSIYAQCEYGHLHASIYSDVIVRRAEDFAPCGIGETGIIQVLSTLPHSYPGHSLLTEDKGTIIGEDGCPCGRKGKYFKVLGRISRAEIRGCSDTFEKTASVNNK